jgi:hypothetical protein
MRLALAVPRGPDRAQLEGMIDDMREIFARERGDAGWAALSRRWTDAFAFSGPVVDDALREVITAARRGQATRTPTAGWMLRTSARS